MDAEGSGGKAVGGGQCQWTSTQSSFMLTHLSGIVADGTRTSSNFKKVHLNSCAKALNEHFKLNRTGDQISNHLKTWRRKYNKINQLRKLSASVWDEDKFIISLDHDHYTSYIQDHKADDEYLNKPLKYYGDLATIFGNSVATGQWAKGSNEALGIGGDGEHDGHDNGATTTTDENGATPSASGPYKRAKVVDCDADPLVGALERASDKLSNAIKEAAIADKTMPDGLFQTVENLPGFEHDHKSFYYAHLVNNPHLAIAFNSLPFDHKITWIARWVSENFPAW